jgi:hypothetical protein
LKGWPRAARALARGPARPPFRASAAPWPARETRIGSSSRSPCPERRGTRSPGACERPESEHSDAASRFERRPSTPRPQHQLDPQRHPALQNS